MTPVSISSPGPLAGRHPPQHPAGAGGTPPVAAPATRRP